MTDDRFAHHLNAQRGTHATALLELRRGAKRTHWMWFVFPQLTGLGRSEMAHRFALSGLEDARAYLAHPVLGPRLIEATRAALDSAGVPVTLFGPLDAMKFASCMTLFAAVAAPGSVFHEALDGPAQADPVTLARVSATPHP